MAKMNKGILGEVSGKIGTVVGSSWRGVPYLRSLPKRRSGNPTEAQLEQQFRFRMTARFILSMKDLLEITFREFANKMTGTNSALAYTIRNAVVGNYPNLNLNYTLALVSRGGLPNVTGAAADQDDLGKLRFNWTDNTGLGHAKADDRAILVVYCPEFGMTVYKTNGALRSALEDVIDVSSFRGRSVETWIAFMSADGKRIATSVHTGQMIVP